MKLKKTISLMLSLVMFFTICQQIPVFADEGGTSITIPSKGDVAGATVILNVKIENNPGINAAVLTFAYDDGLELLDVRNGEAFSCLHMTASKVLSSPFNVTWDGENIKDEDIKDGIIVSLEFKIPEDAVAGTIYNVSASCTDKGISDNNLNPVKVNVVNGKIEVRDFTYGDLNSDRIVDNIDTTFLRRHVAGGYNQTIKEEAADVNNDGEINASDTVLVRRFIVGGYGVTFPYIQNGCKHILEAIPAKEATESEEGNIAYWHCKSCNNYFKDEKGTILIKDFDEEVIIPVLPKSQYEIQYIYGMEPQNIELLQAQSEEYKYYKPNQAKVLPAPILDKYKFLGWSDKNGKMYGMEIPKGTTGDLVLYANWASDRNKAVPVKKLGDPIICEDSDNGIILFAYEIGEIRNVPIFEKYNILSANGLITKGTRKEQTTIQQGNAETIGKSIANTTTNSNTWTLSKEWNETTSVSEEWAEQNGMTLEEAEEFCKSDSNTYNMTNSSGGSSNIIKNDNSSYRITAGRAHDESTYSEEQKYAKFNIDGKLSNSTTVSGEMSAGVNAGLKFPLKIAEANVGAEAGVKVGASNTFAWEIGAGYEQSKFTKDISTGTDSWEQNIDIANSSSTTTDNTSTWNSSEGFTTSQQTSAASAVSTKVSELISEKYSHDSSYTTGGANGESKEYASSNAEEDSYSSSVTYSEEKVESNEITIETTPNVHGSYRIVHAGTAKVFAIVGYDIKNKAYFTYTYSVLDDDTYKEYLDYSYDGSFNDYETSVLPFEIPVFVNDYVNSRITTSKLQVDDNGVVQKYLGSDDDEIIFIPSYYTKKNTTTNELEMIKIKGIAPGLFKNNTNIVGVTLGNFVNEIPDSAFEGCTSLKEIYCPNVVRIGANAFNGCVSLSEFSLPNEIEFIGEGAFDGIPAIKSKAPTKEIANIVANSKVRNITLDISNIKADDFSDMSFDIGEIETFKLLGGGKEYKGLNVKSDAQNTIISSVAISNSDVIPIEVSSPNITLERVTVQSDGLAIVLKADETTLSLEGESNMLSNSVNSIIAKNINLVQLNEETYSAIKTNGSILIHGAVNNNNGYLDESKIVYVSEEEYTNYLTSRKVTFNANGGTVGTEYITASYNAPMGELPIASRDFYTFDGWYTEADGGEKVTAETPMTSLVDITLYAHWIQNGVSGWELASNVPTGAEVVNKKYTYTKTSTTTASSSSLSGWGNPYDSTWVWSDYGNWSSWQDGWVGSSESRAVETRSVYESSNYKTVYRYYRRANSEHAGTGSPYYSYGGNLYTYFLDYELEKKAGTDYSYTLWCDCGGGYHTVWRYGSLDMYAQPYTESVWVSDNYKTQYRYRDRSKIYTYYFRKVENNLESMQWPTDGSNYTVSNVQEWVQYRVK